MPTLRAIVTSATAAKAGLAILTVAVVASALLARQRLAPSDAVAPQTATTAVGLIKPGEVTSVTTPVPLAIAEVLVKTGDELAAGQPIANVDVTEWQRDFEALGVELERARQDATGREQAAARMRVTVAQFDATADATESVAMAQQQSQAIPNRQIKDSVERATATLQLAQANLQRVTKLVAAGLMAKRELEEAEVAHRVAQDDLAVATKAASASENLRSAQETDLRLRRRQSRSSALQELATLEAASQQAALQVRQVQLRHDQASARLTDPVVRAPRAGVVTELAAHAGDRLIAGALVARFATIDPVQIDVDVTPVMANRVNTGAAVQIDIPALNQRGLTGTITAISPVPADNGKYIVTVALPNSQRARLAGLTAEVTFSPVAAGGS